MRDIHVPAGRSLGVLALGLLAFVPATSAGAQTGAGGANYLAKPKVAKVSCVADCASRKRARAGSTLRLSGTSLAGASEVVFLGSVGRGDNAEVEVSPSSDTRLRVEVPMGAVTGPLRRDHQRRCQVASLGPRLDSAPARAGREHRAHAGAGSDGAAPASRDRHEPHQGLRGCPPGCDLLVPALGRQPGLPERRAGERHHGHRGQDLGPCRRRHRARSRACPGAGASGGPARLPAATSFRLTAATATGAQVRSAQANSYERDAFDLYDHMFPIRGKHDFGSSGSRFGSGRSGHSHQGHDVFAKCGTRMVAARGGRVQYAGYHGAAGNYVVIDGAGTSNDYVYMHLAEATPFQEGDRVYTGQRIGAVGETGNAQGCHLHFEFWASPGWYDGGDPFDPLPSLRAWDSWS